MGFWANTGSEQTQNTITLKERKASKPVFAPIRMELNRSTCDPHKQ